MAHFSQDSGLPNQRPSTAKRMIFGVLGVIVLVALIVGVKILLIQKMMAGFKPPAPPVVTALKVTTEEWRNAIQTVGNLRASRGADLGTEVAGLVRAVRFRSGQSVPAGESLVELNADAERAQLQALQAAEDLARTTLARDKEQLAATAVSQATVDADEADLRSKTAQVAQQRALVEKKIVRAPFAGRTGITTVNPGQYLNAGDKVVTLQSVDTLYLDFNVPQREVSRLGLGADVDVAVDAWPEHNYTGKVTAISSAIDTGTRNVMVEATVKNPHHELVPGMFAKVSLAVGTREKNLTLPQSAVAFNPYGATVFVVEQGKNDKGEATQTARETFVTTGATRGDQVAILKGLKEGDLVVTSGQLKLKNGGPLQIDNTVVPHNDANPKPQEQ